MADQADDAVNPCDRHPAVEAALTHLRWQHLPADLQEVSRPICELGLWLADNLPEDPQLTLGLHKLIEAKDCFVRAALAKE